LHAIALGERGFPPFFDGISDDTPGYIEGAVPAVDQSQHVREKLFGLSGMGSSYAQINDECVTFDQSANALPVRPSPERD
jgi:hypothetical protein